MNFAVIQNNVVVNVIVWDDIATWVSPVGTTTVQIPDGAYVGIGSTYNGTEFGPPPQSTQMP